MLSTISPGSVALYTADEDLRNKVSCLIDRFLLWSGPVTPYNNQQYCYYVYPHTQYTAGSTLLQSMPAPVLLLMQYQWTPTPPMRRCMCTSTLTRKTPSSEWRNKFELCLSSDKTAIDSALVPTITRCVLQCIIFMCAVLQITRDAFAFLRHLCQMS